jgi:DNA-binding LacI/PurR family transcriptional regulator
MHATSLAIGVFTRSTAGYYFGAMLSGIHQVTRAAGVPLLVIQGESQDLRLPPFGAEHVVGWIVISPLEHDTANLSALAASGVSVVAVPTAPKEIGCISVVLDYCRETRALVDHLIDRFDALGQAAAEELLAVLRAERDGQPRRIVVPSSVLLRRSCGCAGPEQMPLPQQRAGTPSWPSSWLYWSSIHWRLGPASRRNRSGQGRTR